MQKIALNSYPMPVMHSMISGSWGLEMADRRSFNDLEKYTCWVEAGGGKGVDAKQHRKIRQTVMRQHARVCSSTSK